MTNPSPEEKPVTNQHLREKAEAHGVDYLTERMSWPAFDDPRTKELIDRASELHERYFAALFELEQHLGVER